MCSNISRIIRLGIFLIIFLLLLGLEYAFPRRKRVQKRFGRWIANGSLSLINTLGLRLVNLMIPFAATVAAYDASVNGVGLFNYFSIHLWTHDPNVFFIGSVENK